MQTNNSFDPETTFFSQERFIDAVVASGEYESGRKVRLQAKNSPAYMFGLERPHRFGRREILLAPFGLYAYPNSQCSREDIQDIVRQLRSLDTIAFGWQVRYDHGVLARLLDESGLQRITGATRVLYLDRPYELIFSRFTATARKLVRQAERKGVVVRQGVTRDEVSAYYSIYKKVISERASWGLIYSESMFVEMLKLKEFVTFLVAEVNGEMLAGGWLIRDGNSSHFWECAMNYSYKHYFPYYALINSGIRLACNDGLETFNFGAAASPSIDQFKSIWGAKRLEYWSFRWWNPIWTFVSRACGSISRIGVGSRGR